MSATTQRLPRFAAAAAQIGAGVLAPGVELVRLGQFAQRSGIYLVLIALLLVPALWLPEYRNVLNLGQIVQQSAALAILGYTRPSFSAEANPAENKLSNESPVGRALLGRRRNETVAVKVPRGPARKLKITKIDVGLE